MEIYLCYIIEIHLDDSTIVTQLSEVFLFEVSMWVGTSMRQYKDRTLYCLIFCDLITLLSILKTHMQLGLSFYYNIII